MKDLKIRHIKFAPVMGFGYWYDDYKAISQGSYCHNFVLPFVRIQWGVLFFNPPKQA